MIMNAIVLHSGCLSRAPLQLALVCARVMGYLSTKSRSSLRVLLIRIAVLGHVNVHDAARCSHRQEVVG